MNIRDKVSDILVSFENGALSLDTALDQILAATNMNSLSNDSSPTIEDEMEEARQYWRTHNKLGAVTIVRRIFGLDLVMAKKYCDMKF